MSVWAAAGWLSLCGSWVPQQFYNFFCGRWFSELSPHLHHIHTACIPFVRLQRVGSLELPCWDGRMLCAWQSSTLSPGEAAFCPPQRPGIRVWVCIVLPLISFPSQRFHAGSFLQFVLKCCWNWRFVWVLMSCRPIHAPYTASCHEFCQVGWNPVCQSLRLTPGLCLRLWAHSDNLCVCRERGVSRSRMISRRSESHFSFLPALWSGGEEGDHGEGEKSMVLQNAPANVKIEVLIIQASRT